MENNRIAILSGLFLFGAVMAFLIMPIAFSADTIILSTRDGSNPVSCLEGSELILAQNLTDLCDVVIITPLNTQILQYNGSFWVNANASAFDDTVCANVGTGAQVYKNGECNFRTIVGSADISVVQNLNEIVIDYNGTAGGDTTACTNVGVGTGLICRGGNVDIKSLVQGSGITITNNADDITIANASPDNTVCVNLGGGLGVYKGGECSFNSLIAGTGITITDTTDDLTFAVTGDIPNEFTLQNDITPSQITSDQNNYNPTGLSTATVLRLSTDARRTITGLSGGEDGRIIIIHNIGSFVIRLTDEDAGSSADNRFNFGIEQWLYPNDSIILKYDSTLSRWLSTRDSNSVVISKPSDETVNNSAVLQNDDDLSFVAEANAIYQITHYFKYDIKASSDFKYQWNVPSGSMSGIVNYAWSSNPTASSLDLTAVRTHLGTASVIINYYHVSMVETGVTGGTVQFTWAQNTNIAENTIMKKGSAMLIERVL